jgi:hypothetical protein
MKQMEVVIANCKKKLEHKFEFQIEQPGQLVDLFVWLQLIFCSGKI